MSVEVVSAIIVSEAYRPYNGGPYQELPEPRRILLTQRRLCKSYPFTWECPGGKVEKGETHQEALARELYEELGISLWGMSGKCIARSEYARDKPIYFYCVSNFSPLPRALEGQGLGWFTCKEYEALSLSPGNQMCASSIRHLVWGQMQPPRSTV